ncbi:MAG: hypothetical protein KDC71_07325 [Acidobacteria bacterium]|nr:hypothetical protein [Acidobacteriota bacterium]
MLWFLLLLGLETPAVTWNFDPQTDLMTHQVSGSLMGSDPWTHDLAFIRVHPGEEVPGPGPVQVCLTISGPEFQHLHVQKVELRIDGKKESFSCQRQQQQENGSLREELRFEIPWTTLMRVVSARLITLRCDDSKQTIQVNRSFLNTAQFWAQIIEQSGR